MQTTELTIPPGQHTLLVADVVEGHIAGTFLAQVTLSITGSTAYVVSEDRNAGAGEAYTRYGTGTWLGDRGGLIVLFARI